MSACGQPKPVTWQCDGPDCTSCAQVARCAARVLDLADTLVGTVKTLLAERDEVARAARMHEEAAAKLEAERQKYAELNRRLNARANGIRAVTACEKKESSGRRGRPPGKGATVSRQFEESEADARETADLGACPGCGGELSGVTGEYTRRYERVTVVTEKVLCMVRQRYCRKCKKQYTARPKGVAPQRARLDKLLGTPSLAQRQGPLTWKDRRAELRLSEGARLALRLVSQEGAHGNGAPPRLRSRPREAREGGGPPLRRAVVAPGGKEGGRGNRAGQDGLPDVGRDVALERDAQARSRGFPRDHGAGLVHGLAAHRSEPPDVHTTRCA